MTKYARDEFDRVPETSTRQGVHRAVAESRRRRRLGPILAVGAAALAVGLVAFLFLPKLGFSSAGSTQAVSAEQGGSSAAASAAPTATSPAASSPASASPAAIPASADPVASETAAAATTPSAAAAIDKTQPVAVFNATSTAGLANRVGGTVTTAGWTVGSTGNWGGAPQQRSVVFYGGAEQKGNAEALANLLGIQTVVDSAEFALPLVVVLAPGFQ